MQFRPSPLNMNAKKGNSLLSFQHYQLIIRIYLNTPSNFILFFKKRIFIVSPAITNSSDILRIQQQYHNIFPKQYFSNNKYHNKKCCEKAAIIVIIKAFSHVESCNTIRIKQMQNGDKDI